MLEHQEPSRERPRSTKEPREMTLRRLAQEFEAFIGQEGYGVITPNEFRLRNKRLYDLVRSCIHRPGDMPDWDLFLNHVRPEIAARWRNGRTVRREETSEKMVAEYARRLRRMLSEHPTTTLSPKWIFDHDKDLYGGVLSMIARHKITGWETLLSADDTLHQLPWNLSDQPKLKQAERVKMLGKTDTTAYEPPPEAWKRKQEIKREYRDEKEVADELAPYRDKEYVFFATMDGKDKGIRQKMIHLLIDMAQRGNIAAREKLYQLLEPVMQEWVEGAFSDMDQAIMQKAAFDCIRLTTGERSFLPYLRTTLFHRMQHGSGDVDRMSDEPSYDSIQDEMAEALDQRRKEEREERRSRRAA